MHSRVFRNPCDSRGFSVPAPGPGARVRDNDIWLAAAEGNVDFLRPLLERGEVDVNAQNADGNTPLILAATYGRDYAASVLLEFGADVNARCATGETALHSAVYKDHDSVVRILIEAGADIGAVDRSNRTPLHIAVRERHSGSVSRLLRALEAQRAAGREAAAVLDARDHEGATALSLAVQRNWLEGVRMLLEAGADAEIPDRLGRTPLAHAALLNNGWLVQALMARGAQPRPDATGAQPADLVKQPVVRAIVTQRGSMGRAPGAALASSASPYQRTEWLQLV